MKKFGDRLRSARAAAGMTQEQLAFRVGVTKSSVSAWENGRESPSFHLLPGLCTSLSCSLDQLVLGTSHSAFVLTEGQANRPEGSFAKDFQEQSLLIRFRGLSARRREAILTLMMPED